MRVSCFLFLLAWMATARSVPALGSAPAVAISGSVIEEGAGAAAGARVELWPVLANFHRNRQRLAGETPVPVAQERTDRRGRYRLSVPHHGVWKIRVEREGSVAAEYGPVALANPMELPPVVLRRAEVLRLELGLPGEGDLTGTWLRAVTAGQSAERPVGLGAWEEGWRAAPRSAAAGSSAVVSVPRAPGERLHLTVFRPDRLVPLELEADEDVSITLSGGAAASRRLRVVSRSGEPAAGVLLTAAGRPWSISPESGTFELPGPLPELQLLRFLAEDGRSFQWWWWTPEGEATAARLEEPAWLTGRVVDAAGGPVAGALVWSNQDPGRWTTAAEDGSFRWLSAESTGSWWLEARAPGRLPALRVVNPDAGLPAEVVTLTLRPAAGLIGRVKDEDGAALAGVQVEAHHPAEAGGFRPDPAADRAASGPHGDFLLSALLDRTAYQLKLTKPGFLPRYLEAHSDASRPPVQVVLERQRAAFGRVLDLDEEPIAGALVLALPAAAATDRESLYQLARDGARSREVGGESDAEGRFEIAQLPDRKVTLAAWREGYALNVVPGVETVAGAGVVDLGTLLLEPSAQLSGQVEEEGGGGPISGVSVWAVPEPVSSVWEAARGLEARRPPDNVSGEDGSFLVGELIPERPVSLILSHPDHVPAGVEAVRVPAEAPLRVALRRAAGLSGVVINEEGEAVAGAEVVLRPREPEPGVVDVEPVPLEERYAGFSDTAGGFQLHGVTPGPYVLGAWAEGYQPASEITVEVGNGPTDLEVVLEAGATLVGRTLTNEGEILEDVRVTVASLGAFSDWKGRYGVSGVPPGRQVVEGAHPDLEGVRLETEIHPGENEVDLFFEDGTSLSGRVVDSNGVPVRGAEITLEAAELRHRSYHSRSGADGAFRLPRVVAGSYELRATRSGFAAAELTGLRIGKGPVDGIEVVLPKGGRVVGTVVGLRPEEWDRVQVWAEQDGRQASGVVDYTGAFEVPDLSAGDWLVRAVVDGGRREGRARLSLPAGAEVQRDLYLEGGLTLAGSISLQGVPLGGAEVILGGHDVDVRRQSRSAHDGSFALENLPAGRYRLDVVHHRELLVHNEDLELDSDRQVNVEFTDLPIAGQVLSASGRPLGESLVRLQRLLLPAEASGAGEGAVGSLLAVGTDAEGRFRFARATPGRYRLSVKKDGYAPFEELLDVDGPREDLFLELQPTQGLELWVETRSGRRPGVVALARFEGERPADLEYRAAGAGGEVSFPTVPAGEWRLLVGAAGAAPAELKVTVPGPPVPVVLADGGVLTVRVSPLVERTGVAFVTLHGADGQAFWNLHPSTGERLSRWRVTGGMAELEGVPAGLWSVEVATPSGERWTGTVATDGAGHRQLVLQ